MTKIVQSLARAGLIETREGAKGGIRLARPSEKITLLDVLQASDQERPLFRTDIDRALTGGRPDVIRRRVADNLRQAEGAMKAGLAATTIADLHPRAGAGGGLSGVTADAGPPGSAGSAAGPGPR